MRKGSPALMGLSRNREVEAISCEQQRGWGAWLRGMVNVSELLINVVNDNRLKLLASLNQKVRSRLTHYILGSHGHHGCRRIGRT
jgi:hypothetical protein